MQQSNFRIQLLVGCDGLEHDACRFRTRRFPGTDKSSVCKLCLQEPEDQAHFIAWCPRLEAVRSQLLLTVPPPCSRYDQPIISISLLKLSWVRRGSTITRLRNLPLTFSTSCVSTGTLYSQDPTDSAHEGLLSQCGGYKEEEDGILLESDYSLMIGDHFDIYRAYPSSMYHYTVNSQNFKLGLPLFVWNTVV